MMKFINIFILAFLLKTVVAQQNVEYDIIPEDLVPYIYAKTSDLEWFTDAKFGVFVHWGPYSLAKVPASWGR